MLVTIGRKEKAGAEALLPSCTSELQALYAQTREGNGQRWLMIDLKDNNGLYSDVLSLIDLRRMTR